MITTNIRLSEVDYQKYRIIALKQKKSFAQLVREVLERTNWQTDEDKEEISRKAAESILKARGFTRGSMTIREAIEQGRRYYWNT